MEKPEKPWQSDPEILAWRARRDAARTGKVTVVSLKQQEKAVKQALAGVPMEKRAIRSMQAVDLMRELAK